MAKVLNITSKSKTNSYSLGKEVEKLGYYNPNDDTDKRYPEAMAYIFEDLVTRGYTVALEPKVGKDVLETLPKMDGSSRFYRFLQPRADREGENIEGLYERFYGNRETLKRIIIAFRTAREGDLTTLPLFGNRRALTHKFAVCEKEEETLCDLIVIESPSDLSDVEVLRDLKKLSRLGNRADDEATREVQQVDYVHNLQTEWQLIQEDLEGEHLKYSQERIDDDIYPWAVKFLREEENYITSEEKYRSIINKAFSAAHGHKRKFETEEDKNTAYTDVFTKSFPTEDFSDGNGIVSIITTESVISEPWVPAMKQTGFLKDNESFEFNVNRTRINIIIELGNGNSSSLSSLQKSRKRLLKKMQEHNLSLQMEEMNVPLYERVVFPKQLQAVSGDKDAAYLWSMTRKEWVEMQ